MIKTIKELADELGVSKTAIRNKMTADFREKWVQTLTANGVQILVITDEGVNIIKSMFRGGSHTANILKAEVSTQVANLQMEIDLLKQQLKEKDKQIDQQQQLTLLAMKDRERLQLELDAYKDEKEHDKNVRSENNSLKRWYEFWK